MPNPNREYDKSDLTVEMYEKRIIIHRDIIAHSFRWSHIVKFLLQNHRYKDEIIFDVGCGRDLPLPRLMYANRLTGFAYIGVDINKLEIHEQLKPAIANGKMEVQLIEETDAGLVKYEDLEFTHPTLATAFECFEHMQPRALVRLIKNVYSLLVPNGDFFCSTPVYNGSAAANHINEMSYSTVGWLLEQCGFYIQNKYGTFASMVDVKDSVDIDYPGLYDRLGKYYDSNIQAIMFAPMYPYRSRNVIWHCKKSHPPSSLFPQPGIINQNKSWPTLFQEMMVK